MKGVISYFIIKPKTMAKAYDYDLRKRVINLINKGKKRRFISQLLNVSVPTIDRWIAIYKNTGVMNPTIIPHSSQLI